MEKLGDKWSYWYKVFFGGTNCEVKHLGLIVRVPGQKNTHRKLKVDTIKCNSGAMQPNPPQRIHKSAQSCGHPPSSVNHLKHPGCCCRHTCIFSRPQLHSPPPCSSRASEGTAAGATSPEQLRAVPEHTQRVALPASTGSDCRLVFMSFTLQLQVLSW